MGRMKRNSLVFPPHFTRVSNQVNYALESARQSLGNFFPGGKSGLRRAGCQVTPGGREPTASAAENIPPASAGKGEMVR